MRRRFFFLALTIIATIFQASTLICSEAGTSADHAIEHITIGTFWDSQALHTWAVKNTDIPWSSRNLLIVLGIGETEDSELMDCKNTILQALNNPKAYILTRESFWLQILKLEQSKFRDYGLLPSILSSLWDCYRIPHSGLVLLSPQAHHRVIIDNQSIPFGQLFKGPSGLKLDTFEKIEQPFARHSFSERPSMIEQKSVLGTFKQLFVTKEEQGAGQIAIVWDIFLDDVGSRTTIAGFSHHQFRDMLIFFNNDIWTNLLVYLANFSGSFSNRTLPYLQEDGDPITLNYTVINPASHPGENTTSFILDDINPRKDTYSSELHQGPLTSRDIMAGFPGMFISPIPVIDEHCPHIFYNPNNIPYVRWPAHDEFEIMETQLIKIITPQVIDHASEKSCIITIKKGTALILLKAHDLRNITLFLFDTHTIPTVVNQSNSKEVYIETLILPYNYIQTADSPNVLLPLFMFNSPASTDAPTSYFIKNIRCGDLHWHNITVSNKITSETNSVLTRASSSVTQELFACKGHQLAYTTLTFLPGFNTRSVKKCTRLTSWGIPAVLILSALGCLIAGAIPTAAHQESLMSTNSLSLTADQHMFSATIWAGIGLTGLAGLSFLTSKITNRSREKKLSQDISTMSTSRLSREQMSAYSAYFDACYEGRLPEVRVSINDKFADEGTSLLS